MARRRRSCPPGIIFHLCNRTAGAVPLFRTNYDYAQILKVFLEGIQRFPVSLFAYCIMPNHWHLLGQAQKPKALSLFMHWFGTTHAARYRHSHASVGRGAVYQNRFRSHPVVGSWAFYKTAAYIERNPLEASLASEASAWPWSSATDPGALPLTPWPFPKPSDWKRRLNRPLDPEVLRQIHYSETSTQALQHPLSQTKARPLKF